jgi:hypothetical protein
MFFYIQGGSKGRAGGEGGGSGCRAYRQPAIWVPSRNDIGLGSGLCGRVLLLMRKVVQEAREASEQVCGAWICLWVGEERGEGPAADVRRFV